MPRKSQVDRQRVMIRSRHGTIDSCLSSADRPTRENPVDGSSITEQRVRCGRHMVLQPLAVRCAAAGIHSAPLLFSVCTGWLCTSGHHEDSLCFERDWGKPDLAGRALLVANILPGRLGPTRHRGSRTGARRVIKPLVPIPGRFANEKAAETGIGYQVLEVRPKDGRSCDHVAARHGYVIAVRGHRDI